MLLSGLALALSSPLTLLPAAHLGIQGTRFTLDGKPTFLVGASYYGALGAPEEAIRRDLQDLRRHGFNWIRVWATWAAFGHDVSAVDGDGWPREPYLSRLKWLQAECDREAMVVDVTLSRGNGITGPSRLETRHAHLRAVETLVGALKPHQNWYLDLSNERNIRDRRFASWEDLRELRAAVRRLDPGRLVTASHAGDIKKEELREYLRTVEVDFVSPHRPRNRGSPAETEARARECLSWMEELGRPVPLHYQEPFRRGFEPRRWEPPAEAFLADLRAARAGGGAGWCFHNGDQRDRSDGRPRRSFDLREKRLFEAWDDEERKALQGIRLAERPSSETPRANLAPGTRLSIQGGKWHLNGGVTYRGAKAEGLLLNVRVVNAIFEDRKRPDFDPEANTAEFIDRIPEYVSCGVRAFTVSFQGGMPGYEGALNSAFEPDGSLRADYLKRTRRVIEACDQSGAAVILGCFYQRQDQVLQDEATVRAAVTNAARWVRENGFANVLLEIANEFSHPGFDHQILRSPEGQADLLRLARETAPGLLVSTSGIGDGKLDERVAASSDFLLIHLNGVPLPAIPSRLTALKGFQKPIVCNEDDKLGEEAAKAAELCVAGGASWGLMLLKVNQTFPFTFGGAADDPIVYRKLKELVSP